MEGIGHVTAGEAGSGNACGQDFVRPLVRAISRRLKLFRGCKWPKLCCSIVMALRAASVGSTSREKHVSQQVRAFAGNDGVFALFLEHLHRHWTLHLLWVALHACHSRLRRSSSERFSAFDAAHSVSIWRLCGNRTQVSLPPDPTKAEACRSQPTVSIENAFASLMSAVGRGCARSDKRIGEPARAHHVGRWG